MNMLTSPLYDFQKANLQSRLSFQINQEKLFSDIDTIPQLHGASVYYVDNRFIMVKLRSADTSCNLKPLKIILREPPGVMDERQLASHLNSAATDERESKLVGEVAGMALSCTAAALAWVVVIGSAAVIPLTGGGSTVLTVLGYTAAAAGTAQCVNGIVRTGAEIARPELNDYLDSQEWYTSASTALDVISLAGAGVAGALTIRSVKLLQASTGKGTIASLKGLTRHERKRITQEIIRLNHPGVSSQVMKTLIKAGQYPVRYSGVQISQAVKLQLKDAFTASLSFVGSASAGTVKALAIGIYEEFE